jgi:hypothetical protein
MYHIALPLNADDKQNMSLGRRRASSRPFSSTSGFMQSYLSEVGNSSANQSSAESDQSQIVSSKDLDNPTQKIQMQKKIKRLQQQVRELT